MAALGGGDEGRQGGGGQGRGRKSRGMGRRGQGGGGEGGQEEAGEEARGRRDVVFRPAAEPPTAMGWDSTADTTRRAGGVLPIHHRLGPRQQRGRVLRERRYGGGGEGGEGEERPDRLSPQRGLALPPTSPRPPPRRALTRAVASTATAAATAVAAPVAATAATAATVATAEMAAVTAVTASAAEALLAPLRTDARSDCRARGGSVGRRHGRRSCRGVGARRACHPPRRRCRVSVAVVAPGLRGRRGRRGSAERRPLDDVVACGGTHQVDRTPLKGRKGRARLAAARAPMPVAP